VNSGKDLAAFEAAAKRKVVGKGKGSAHQSNGGSKLKSSNATDPAAVATPEPFSSTGCTGGSAMHQSLSSASSAQLRKLAAYEQLCSSAPFVSASFFVPTSTNASNARSNAYDVAVQLKEFARFGIKPLIFMEPTDDGNLIDLNAYQNGAYDSALDAFYAQLRNLGIDDAGMGTWVLLPEGNLPEWTTVDPNVYSAVVTRTAQLQKKQFPSSRVALMLDSMTYPSANSWNGGRYVSLLPYVQAIPAGLIDSFGVQGFPWAAPAGQAGSSYDPAVYLRTDLAVEAARSLGAQEVWVNTGTFHQMYAGQPSKKVTLTAQQRKTMLDGVLAQMNTIRAAGLNPAIHIFAEDKSHVSEGTDWSYGDADAAVLTTFIHDARTAGLPLWLYDAVH
jgi:hypothetical protein